VLDSTIDEVKKTGAKYICRSGDVCDKAVSRMLVDDTVKEFGSIDILVNNAGLSGAPQPPNTLKSSGIR